MEHIRKRNANANAANTSTTSSSGVQSIEKYMMNMTLNDQPTKVDQSILKRKYLKEMGYTNTVEEGPGNVQPQKKGLIELMQNVISHQLNPNVQIRIGLRIFKCHMLVLQCYSDFFMECDQEVLFTLPEEKVSATAFRIAYNWMLAENPIIKRESIVELLIAAEFLRIRTLTDHIWMCLDNDVHFREDTAFMLYSEAKMHNLSILQEVMITRIWKFFLTLVSSKNFVDLPIDELCCFLNLNTIGVNSEIEVFMSVVRWLSYDWHTRKTNLLTVVKCVRFNLMPSFFLLTLMHPTDSMEINRITDDPEVKIMINEALYCISTNMLFKKNRAGFYDFLERHGMALPVQRVWIYDRECSYHHHLDCDALQAVSYETFLEYLIVIGSYGKNYWQKLELAKSNEKCLQCQQKLDLNQNKTI